MRTKILTGLFAASALVATAVAADAKVMELKVRSGSDVNTTSVTFAGPTATLTNNGSVNGINYTSQGTSTELPNNISVTTSTAGTNTDNSVKTITYMLTVTDLTGQPTIQGWQDLFSGINPIVGGQTISNVFTRVYYDAANVKYGTANLVYDSGFPAGCGFPPAYSCSASGSLSLPNPFSLTQLIVVTYKAGAAGIPVTSSATFSAVPEPTSLALLGSGLLLAGWMFRRRRNDKTA